MPDGISKIVCVCMRACLCTYACVCVCVQVCVSDVHTIDM